jgi:hypothetical protein
MTALVVAATFATMPRPDALTYTPLQVGHMRDALLLGRACGAGGGWCSTLCVPPPYECVVSVCLSVRAAAAAQVWLEEFAWAEDDKDRAIKKRASSTPQCPTLKAEPIFVFETAVKLYYWSHIIYDYTQQHGPARLARQVRPSLCHVLNLRVLAQRSPFT